MLWAFVAWSVLIWTTRLKNIVDDPEQASWQMAVPAVLLLLAGLAAGRAAVGRPRWGATALAAATVAVWAVRLPVLLADSGHGTAFKAVHAGLAVVSLGLAAAVLRVERRSRAARPTVDGALTEPATGVRRG